MKKLMTKYYLKVESATKIKRQREKSLQALEKQAKKMKTIGI